MPWLQDLAFGKPQEAHMSPLLELAQVALDGILRHANHTTQLGVIHKLAEGALDPSVYVIDEENKQYWSQCTLLGQGVPTPYLTLRCNHCYFRHQPEQIPSEVRFTLQQRTLFCQISSHF